MLLALSFATPVCGAEKGTLRTYLRVTVQIIDACDKQTRHVPLRFAGFGTQRGLVKPHSAMTVCADDRPVVFPAPDDRAGNITWHVIY